VAIGREQALRIDSEHFGGYSQSTRVFVGVLMIFSRFRTSHLKIRPGGDPHDDEAPASSVARQLCRPLEGSTHIFF